MRSRTFAVGRSQRASVRAQDAVQSNKSTVPLETVPFFGDNVIATTRSKTNGSGKSQKVKEYTAHMRPESYGGINLSLLEFVDTSPFGTTVKKRVPLAIAAHPNQTEGGLAKFLCARATRLPSSSL